MKESFKRFRENFVEHATAVLVGAFIMNLAVIAWLSFHHTVWGFILSASIFIFAAHQMGVGILKGLRIKQWITSKFNRSSSKA